jgi:heme/copper-type cytochrome/quinol oxidase subunit 2
MEFIRLLAGSNQLMVVVVVLALGLLAWVMVRTITRAEHKRRQQEFEHRMTEKGILENVTPGKGKGVALVQPGNGGSEG